MKDLLWRGLLTLCALSLLASGQTWSASGSPITHDAEQPSAVEINRFVDTINTIKDHYAKAVDEKKLLEDAVRGMVDNLDPHSEYLNEEAYKSLLITTNGEFGGLGIEVASVYGVLKVITPIDDTPAAKAGIKSGDYIVALNDKLVSGMTADQAINLMRGKEGTRVTLTIIRKNDALPLKFTITRAMIHTDAVKSKLIAPGYGYVRISQFQQSTAPLLLKAIAALKEKSGGELKGFILDLRNNPGGLLETAVSVSNAFLESDKLNKFDKLIVYTEGRVPDAAYQAKATGHDALKGAPIIILINEGSASASEIVAGALQDYQRATIVGNTSFGKGSVQTVIPLDKTHAIKLTTALYHTPSGRIIQNRGIIPDIFLPKLKIESTKNDVKIDPIREFQLRDHLKDSTLENPTLGNTAELATLASEDFQLYEAFNILKTLTLPTESMR